MNELGQIEEMLGALYEMVQDAKNVPFSSDKCAIERERVLDLLDEISNKMPGEIKQAKTITENRNELITTAKREAEVILKNAQAKARQLVAHEAIYNEAREQANEMVRAAEERINEMMSKAVGYLERSLAKTEEAVAKTLADVRDVRSQFRGQQNTQKTTSPIIEEV